MDKMPCHITDSSGELPYFEEECEDEAYDRLRQERIDDKLSPVSKLTGWSSSYYEIPQGAKELQDLIEHRGMNFSVGNIFKAAYRLGHKANTTAVYDLDKIIWFAQREKARVLAQEERNEDVQRDVNGSEGHAG